MYIHIVQQGETLDKIARNYNIELEELLEHNQHIYKKTVYQGMKISIPLVKRENNEEFDEKHPLIEDYYPTLDEKIEKEETKEAMVNVQQSSETQYTQAGPNANYDTQQSYSYSQAVPYYPGYPQYPQQQQCPSCNQGLATYPQYYQAPYYSANIQYQYPGYQYVPYQQPIPQQQVQQQIPQQQVPQQQVPQQIPQQQVPQQIPQQQIPQQPFTQQPFAQQPISQQGVVRDPSKDSNIYKPCPYIPQCLYYQQYQQYERYLMQQAIQQQQQESKQTSESTENKK